MTRSGWSATRPAAAAGGGEEPSGATPMRRRCSAPRIILAPASLDRVAALAWLLRGRAGGSALAASFLASARAALSTDEIAEAERRAQALPGAAP